LKDSTSLLPDVVCAVAEKLIELHRLRHGQGAFDRFYSSGHYISELIVRLYQQSVDSKTKSRCLDIIDEMLRVEIWSAEEELEKAER
jgi:predicted nucleic acid-binding protein